MSKCTKPRGINPYTGQSLGGDKVKRLEKRVQKLELEVVELKNQLKLAEGERDIAVKHYIAQLDQRLGVDG